MSEPRWAFTHSDDIRFGDLDSMGHLNNVAFLVLLESARVAYALSLDPDRDPVRPSGYGTVVAEVKLAYRSPGMFGERVDTRLRPEELGRTSLRIAAEMRVGDRLLADGYTVMVLVDPATTRPMPLPEHLRERLIADGARPRESVEPLSQTSSGPFRSR